jgi:hypothetical protein
MLIKKVSNTDTTLVEGFSKGASNEAYHSNTTHVSSSGLKTMLYSPKKYYERYVLGKEDTEPKPQAAFDFGSYIHSRVLEPELVESEYAFFEGAVKRGAAWDKFKLENSDRIIMSNAQVKMADKMMDSYQNSGIEIGVDATQTPFSNFFQGGESELTCCAPMDGIDCKVRFDYYKSGEDFYSINDVKTTALGNLDIESVEDICELYHYDLSAALYADVAQAVTGHEHAFYFLFMSKKPPFDVQLFKASDAMLARGREKYRTALHNLNNALETGIFYENKILELK